MKYVSILIIIFFLSSCTDFYNENQMLRNELRNMEIEIASIKGSPGYLLGEAFEMIDQNEFIEVEKLFDSLKVEFPEWNKKLVEEFSKRFIAEIE